MTRISMVLSDYWLAYAVVTQHRLYTRLHDLPIILIGNHRGGVRDGFAGFIF